ncbi:MAG: hypothetical protein GOU99_02555 [Candidatus Altiarchaeota archaeon]|nr:hypothetical protein [Candidatus Altiarchaeota archaeon]
MRRSAFLLFLLLIPTFAGTAVINSNDWREVLAGMQLAKLEGHEVRFLVSVRQADVLAQNLPPNNVTVIETSNPIMQDYANYLENAYDIETNELLFRNYREIQNHILRYYEPSSIAFISEYEPENAVLSLPMMFRESGVVFVSEPSIFSRMGVVEKIYIIGHLQRDHQRTILSTAGALGKSVKIINQGSPYANGLAVLDVWGRTDKAILTTGEFFETTLSDGSHPVLLVGKEQYPEGLIESLDTAGINQVYVIGSDLLSVAQKIREDSGRTIGVMVKYGEGYLQAGTFSEVLALTIFQIPMPQPNITFTRAIYDSTTNKLYITLFNQGDGAAYFLTNLQIAQNGSVVSSIRDNEMILIWPGEEVTQTFTIDLASIGSENMTAILNGKYGRFEDFLVKTIEQERPIEFGVLEDNSNIEMIRATYDGTWIRVYIKNIAGVTAYVSGYVELTLDGELRDFYGGDLKIESGKTGVLKVKIELTEEDLLANSIIPVNLRYGEKRSLLVKTLKQYLELEVVKFNLMLIVGIAIPLLITMLLIVLMRRRERSKYYKVRKRFRKIKRTKLRPKRRSRPRRAVKKRKKS